jgi:hypothetical protein
VPDAAGGHLSLVWALVWCIVIASLFGAILSATSLGWVQKLAGMSPARLLPFILMLVIVGTIGERHLAIDLGVVAVLGVVGYSMSELAWPRAPLMLGFVLGPLLERRWLLSHSMYGWRWALRPGVLLLVALAALLLSVVARTTQEGAASNDRAQAASPGDAEVSYVLATLATGGLAWTWTLAPQAAFFPRLAFAALLAAAAACVWDVVRRRRRDESRLVARLRTHAVRLGWLWGFIGATWLFGPVLGAAVATALYASTEARSSWQEAAGLTAAVGATAYAFVWLLMPFSTEAAIPLWLAP